MEYDMNITVKGENILKKLANDERMVEHNNLFFKPGIISIDNYDFYKRFGTSYDFFYDLISEKISFKEAVIEKSEMIKK